MATLPWTEKYRPHTLDGYIFQNETQRGSIQRIIDAQEIPQHLLMCGVQGSGKTTLARILIKSLGVDEMDLLEENASDKTGVDFIRDTIIPFVESSPMGRFKVVHLEEFDYLSHNAQGMLRAVMEEYVATCKFICTCNYENKVLPAMKSRMQVLHFKAPIEDDVIIKMIEMLDAEGITFDPETLMLYVKQAYPDIRKIINNLQLNSVNKTLQSPRESGDADYMFALIDFLQEGDFASIYETVLKNAATEEVERLYEFLWQNLKLVPAVQASGSVYERCVLVIADGIRAHAVSAFPHITFQATCIKLTMTIHS